VQSGEISKITRLGFGQWVFHWKGCIWMRLGVSWIRISGNAAKCDRTIRDMMQETKDDYPDDGWMRPDIFW